MVSLSDVYKEIKEGINKRKQQYAYMVLGGIFLFTACTSPYISHQVKGRGRVEVYCNSKRCEVHGGAYIYGKVKDSKDKHRGRTHYHISVRW